jgi:hypothetical protein
VKARWLLKIAPAVLLLTGCAHQNFTDQCVIYDNEIVGWRESALGAINSPDEWERVGVRITKDQIRTPIASHFIYILYKSRPDIVEVVARLPMKRFQEQGYHVRVTMGRSSACVLSMREEYDP